MQNTKTRRVICCVWIAFFLVFIWGNSLLPAEISRKISRFVRSLLGWLFSGSPTGGGGKGEGLLRKLAHFAEFCALGMGLAWLLGMLKKHSLLPLCCGILVAWIDEGIQYFVPGRHAALRDVCIDTLGVALGLVLVNVAYFWSQKRKTGR